MMIVLEGVLMLFGRGVCCVLLPRRQKVSEEVVIISPLVGDFSAGDKI